VGLQTAQEWTESKATFAELAERTEVGDQRFRHFNGERAQMRGVRRGMRDGGATEPSIRRIPFGTVSPFPLAQLCAPQSFPRCLHDSCAAEHDKSRHSPGADVASVPAQMWGAPMAEALRRSGDRNCSHRRSSGCAALRPLSRTVCGSGEGLANKRGPQQERVRVCLRACVRMYVRVRVCTRMYLRMRVYLCLCLCVCGCVCVGVSPLAHAGACVCVRAAASNRCKDIRHRRLKSLAAFER
jgi:hypothetical protein